MKKLPAVLRGLYIGLIFVLLYLPVALMIVLSFNASKSAYEWGGFSLWKYRELFADERIMEALGTTVVVGFAAAALATVLGTLGCLGMLAMRKRLQKTVSTVANIPLLNADIVTGVALMLFFTAIVGRMNTATLLISHITLILPYVVLNVYPKISQLDTNVYEAALDLGASPVKAFFKVVLPEIFPGVLTGFLLALTISLDDFTITYFTKGQGLNTLSTYIYTNKIRGIQPEYYALTALTFVAVLFLILVIQLVNVRSSAGEQRLVSSERVDRGNRFCR